MALVESLLTAIVRADGDALVMHVGEKPYVVASAGPIELSTQGLNLEAMAGMIAQLLPEEQQRALIEFGAVEHELPSSPATQGDRFTLVAARGGDDVWIEIRRHRRPRVAAGTLDARVEPMASVAETSTPYVAPAQVQPSAPLAAVPEEPAVIVEEPVAVEIPPMGAPLAVTAPAVAYADTPASLGEAPPAVAYTEIPATFGETSPAVAHVEPPASLIEVSSAGEPDPVVAHVEPHVGFREDITASVRVEVPASFGGTINDEADVDPRASLLEVDHTPPEEIIASMHTPEPQRVESLLEAPAIFESQIAETAIAAETPINPGIDEHQIVVEVPIAENVSIAAAAPIVEESPVFAADPSADLVEAAALAEEASVSQASLVTPMQVHAVTDIREGASVIPITRASRIDVQERTVSGRSGIGRLLSMAASRGASALYLTSQAPPCLRFDGDVRVLDGEPSLSSHEVESAVFELTPEALRESVRRGELTEWATDLAEIGRVRCSTFRDYRGAGAMFQLIAVRPLSAEQLGLGRDVQALATETEGLVVVTSPRGAGKSTLVGAFVDLINRQRNNYVITIERQIRMVHENRNALISQREASGTAEQAVELAQSALGESPDVLVIEDLASPEMLQLALNAAGSGILVFVTLTGTSTTAALTSFVDVFPPEQRKAVELLLSERLRGAIAQVLLRKTGGGRVAARELLLTTAPVAALLADGQLQDLPLALESGRKHGMVPLNDALLGFVRSGAVDARDAYRKADDREGLLKTLKREGVSASLVERLA